MNNINNFSSQVVVEFKIKKIKYVECEYQGSQSSWFGASGVVNSYKRRGSPLQNNGEEETIQLVIKQVSYISTLTLYTEEHTDIYINHAA